MVFALFLFTFRKFYRKFSQFCQNLFKLFTISVVGLIFKDKNKFFEYFDLFFWVKLGKYLKIQPFSSKIAPNKLLSSTLIKFAGSTHPKTTNMIFVNSKGATPHTSIYIESALE